MFNVTRIRLYPNKEQQQKLAVQFGCARWVYNNALDLTQKTYQETGKGLKYNTLSARLPKLKKEFKWLDDAYGQVLQQSLHNLATAFDGFFAKRGGYPRFKKKHDRQSIQYPQKIKFNETGKRLYLPKIGFVKCIVHRDIEIVRKIKTVTVSKNSCGQYYASILIDNGKSFPPVSTDGKAIGIDVGLINIAVTSDEGRFSNQKHLKKAERNLKRKQRKLSRKKKGSNTRNKARRLVARAHQRIKDIRRDTLHKISRRIVNENQVVIVEDLNVKSMVKNRSLAKSISDAGWGTLIRFLKYKCEREGKAFLKVSRWFPSSKVCSSCGAIHDKMGLEIRHWICDYCGAHHDRDINAAINIRNEGLRMLTSGTWVTASRGTISRRGRLGASRSARPKETGNSSR